MHVNAIPNQPITGKFKKNYKIRFVKYMIYDQRDTFDNLNFNDFILLLFFMVTKRT